MSWTKPSVILHIPDEFKSSFLNFPKLNIMHMSYNFKITFQKNVWGIAAGSHLLACPCHLNALSPDSYCGINGGSLSSLSFKQLEKMGSCNFPLGYNTNPAIEKIMWILLGKL